MPSLKGLPLKLNQNFDFTFFLMMKLDAKRTENFSSDCSQKLHQTDCGGLKWGRYHLPRLQSIKHTKTIAQNNKHNAWH